MNVSIPFVSQYIWSAKSMLGWYKKDCLWQYQLQVFTVQFRQVEKKITYHIIYQWIDLWKKILKAQGPTKFDSIYKKNSSPPICFGRMKIGAFFVPPKHAFSLKVERTSFQTREVASLQSNPCPSIAPTSKMFVLLPFMNLQERTLLVVAIWI